MKSFRFFLMLTAVLMTATVAHAQAPSAGPVTTAAQPESTTGCLRFGFVGGFPLRWVDQSSAQSERYEAPGYPRAAYERLADPACCQDSCWPTAMFRQSHLVWQRIRSMCLAGTHDAPCEAMRAKSGGCPFGVIVASAQSPKACCCSKACACCESCSAKKTGTAAVPATPASLKTEMLKLVFRLPGMGAPMMPPARADELPAFVPPPRGIGVVQMIPVQSARVVTIVPVAQQARPVRLATPDLEAHCERMHHHGDTIVLEGKVLLLVKKHAQPIRIEAHRVVVNMKDGSFQVDSQVRPSIPSTFGVQRISTFQIPESGITPVRGVMFAPPWTHHSIVPSLPMPCPQNECVPTGDELLQWLIRLHR